jgi:uncharacterized damage-inducible protein DinB
MAATPVAEYLRWFEYERESHAKVVDSLIAVPLEKRSAPEFQKAVDLLAHVITARRMWLYRLGVGGEAPNTLFPANTKLEDLAAELAAVEETWESYLGKIDDAELVRPFEYRSIDGKQFRNAIHDILTQLFGHSLYHRGQIAALIRSMGCEPAITDFIYWTREPL